MPHLFVDNLTVIDCSVLDPERGLIGASWIVDIELFGELDQQSMVFDFGHIKKKIKQIIDNEVDHKLVIPDKFKGTNIDTNSLNNTVQVSFNDLKDGEIQHVSPSDALCLVASNSITHEIIIEHLKKIIQPELPSNVEGLELHLHQEDAYGFYYCYSHGLKKHNGNCQRIAHGHRSKIEIWENNDRSRTWEQFWSNTLTDIYIGSKSDIKETCESRTRFAYDAPQGHFEIELDNNRVHLINTDSTVECIADHIAKQIKSNHPSSQIKVKAYEGVKKGAIASY